MVIDGEAAGSLLEQLKIANDAEGSAIVALNAAIQTKTRDKELIRALFKDMTEAHNKTMDIRNQLQQFRLDQ